MELRVARRCLAYRVLFIKIKLAKTNLRKGLQKNSGKKTFVHFLKIHYTLFYERATLEYSC